MPFCVSFFESTVDALLALDRRGHDARRLIGPPDPRAATGDRPLSAIALVSYVAGRMRRISSPDCATPTHACAPSPRAICSVSDPVRAVRSPHSSIVCRTRRR